MPADSPSLDQEDVPATEAATLSSLYSFLALTMRYPEPSFCSGPLFEALASLLESLDWSGERTLMQTWLDQTPDPLDELRTAYTSLFITSTPRTTIPP